MTGYMVWGDVMTVVIIIVGLGLIGMAICHWFSQ